MLGIRAENIEIIAPDDPSAVRARVVVVEPLGSHNLVTLAVGGEQLKATTRPDERHERDQDVGIRIDPERIRWLDAERVVALGADDAAGPGAGLGAVTAEERDPAVG